MNASKSSELAFYRLSLAECISSLGSAISSFSIGLYLYEKTGESWILIALYFATLTPRVYFSIFAGWIADHFDKRKSLFVLNLAQLLLTGVLLAYAMIAPERFTTLIAIGFAILFGVCDSVQFILYSSSIRSFIRTENLLRFNGVYQMIQAAPAIAAPAIAVILYHFAQLKISLAVDVLTFIPILVCASRTVFPSVAYRSQFKPAFLADLKTITHKIFQSDALRTSLGFFTLLNFWSALTLGVVTPYIIEQAHSNTFLISFNNALSASGVFLGGICLVFFKRLKKPFLQMSAGALLAAIAGRLIPGLLPLGVLLGFGLMIRNVLISMLNSANDTIWQSEVEPQWQGRVFGFRRMVAQGVIPVGLALSSLISKLGITSSQLFIWGGLGELAIGLCLGLILYLSKVGSLPAEI